MRNMISAIISCFCIASQVTSATRIQATRLPSGPVGPEKASERERGQERKLNNYSTKIYEGVPIIVKDSEYSEPDNVKGNYEWPVTLPPKLLRDGFQIQPSETSQPAPITTTEYTTFTYFATRKVGEKTITETDIVVSSNVVTSSAGVEPTPSLPGWKLEQISSTPFDAPPSGFQLMATKTFFTTSTFYTTYLDKEKTITKTRTNVRSSVVTETYSGGQYDYLPGPLDQQSLTPTIEESPQEKYLSLGPNIYGLVKTLFTTFTYNNGLGRDSLEVITQTSTRVFSTSELPESITIAPSPPQSSLAPTSSVQLDRDTLLSLKDQFVSQQSSEVPPSSTATYVQSSSEVSSSSSQVETVNLPSGGNTLVRPTTTSSASSSALVTTTQSVAVEAASTTTAPPETGSSATQDAIAGGLLGAVVGGISSALIPQQPPTGLQVDLGPVLDAVATLLRGPIRSAIANRRNTAQVTDRSEVSVQPTASLPEFARIPNGEPNVIPVGGYSSRYPAGPPDSREPTNGFIPINAPQQALPRSDTGLEAEQNYNDISQIPQDILNILEQSNNGGDNPIVIDKDKIVINDHIIRTNDPHIIDVLNKYEHSYLYNQPTDDELKIRIAAGEPMPKPQSNPAKRVQPTKIFGITLPKLNIGGGNRQPKPQPSQNRPQINANNGAKHGPKHHPANNGQPVRRPNPPPNRRPTYKPPPPNVKRPYNINRPPPPQTSYSKPVKNNPAYKKPSNNLAPSYNKPSPSVPKPVPPPPQNVPSYTKPISPPKNPYGKIPPQNTPSYTKPVSPPQNPYGNVPKQKNPSYTKPISPPQNPYGNVPPQQNAPSYTKPVSPPRNPYGNVPQTQNAPSYTKPISTPKNPYGKPVPPPNVSYTKPISAPKNPYGNVAKPKPTGTYQNSGVKNDGNQFSNNRPVGPPVKQQEKPSVTYQNSGNYGNSQYSNSKPSASVPYQEKPSFTQQTNPYGVPNQKTSGGGVKNSGINQYPNNKPNSYVSTASQFPGGNPAVAPKPTNTYQNPGVPYNGAVQQPRPPQVSVIDSSANQIPGSNQWNTYGPGQTKDRDDGNTGQITSNKNPGTGVHSQHGVSPSLNSHDSNPEDSLSSVSEESKVVMIAPPGMIEHDNEGHFTSGDSASDRPSLDPNIGAVSHAHHNVHSNAGNNNNKPRPPPGTGSSPVNNVPNVNSNFGSKVPRPFTGKPYPAVPRPSRPPPSRPSRPARPPTRRPTFSANTRRPVKQRPNQVPIDVPAFPPSENGLRDPYGGVLSGEISPGEILREPHVPPPTLSLNPLRARQTATTERFASVIQGSNQIIGNGGGIVIASPTRGYMKDVTITGSDGNVAVIQTRHDGLPEIDPSFTVTAGYPAQNTEVYTIPRTTIPSFSLVKGSSSGNKYEYEGWLTDGDPLKNLPPLRATASQKVDYSIVQTEAPKTVTYKNEWNTPTELPSAEFVPVSPPPPASNFEREWKTYKTGQVETLDVIRPTNTLDLLVRETEAPKTVTYQNEWFANTAAPDTSSSSSGGNDNSNFKPDFVKNNRYTTIKPLRTPRPSRPKYNPRKPFATIEKASVTDRPRTPTRGPSRAPTGTPTRRNFVSVSDRPRIPYRSTLRPRPRRPTPSAEIITGGVRVPPRPPQTYDPYAEYQEEFPELVTDDIGDTDLIHSSHGFGNRPAVLPVVRRPSDGSKNYNVLLQNAVKNGIEDKVDVDPLDDNLNDVPLTNIKVSSDGYNGYKEINVGYPDKDQDSDAYNDQFIKTGGSGVNEYPPLVTTANPDRPTNNGIISENVEPSTNKTYHSSEYVNEVRYPPPIRISNDRTTEDQQTDEGGAFIPTTRPRLKEDSSGGRESSEGGKLDLNHFLDHHFEDEDKSHIKRKFETSSTRKTFSTKGEPTFINIDVTTALPGIEGDKKDQNDDEGEKFIVTKPITNTDERTASTIRPISTGGSTRFLSTLSTTVSTDRPASSIRLGGYPFPKRPRPDLSYKNEEEIKDDEVLNEHVGAAIVEQVPEHILSAEDHDPQTKCQVECGTNEMCHIAHNGETQCKCRPGFGKSTNLPGSKCEKSMMYQIEVHTTSESQETRIVRFNPKAVQKALENSFEDKIKDLYHHSEITSIKVNNNTKRNFELNNNFENADREANEDMKIKLLVQVADENVGGQEEEERIRSLIEPTIKDTKLPLGSDVMVSRVTIDDFDECSSGDYNDCSNKAVCTNTKGSYNCSCMPGYLDITPASLLPGRICSGASTECELCNRNGQCVLDSSEVSCNCNAWFAGKNCQINLKLLLIVGAVSVCLMMIIACGVSCFCCRDRRKKPIPVPYGVSMARLPPNVRQHSMMMDPSGTVKSAMSGRSRQQMPRHGAPPPHPAHPHPSLQSRNSGPWQEGFGSVTSVTSRGSHVSPSRAGSRPASHSRASKAALVIPRAKVTPSRGYNNSGYHSDEDRFSSPQEKNRAVSEVESQGSRHRRRSVPSFASSLLGGRGRREDSVDPLLEGFQSDGGDSGGRNSNSTFHRSVSRGDLDAMDRAETRSVARSFNETIIRPVTRRLQSAAGTSTRSNRSTRTSEDGRTMAEKDGGSSFVVSPRQQLYRLHDSDGSFESL